MKAKLTAPIYDKNWSLVFTDVKYDPEYSSHDIIHNPEKADIWYWCQHFGNHFHVSPFLQGNSKDWMMIEFWSSAESYILEACMMICQQLNIELNM